MFLLSALLDMKMAGGNSTGLPESIQLRKGEQEDPLEDDRSCSMAADGQMADFTPERGQDRPAGERIHPSRAAQAKREPDKYTHTLVSHEVDHFSTNLTIHFSQDGAGGGSPAIGGGFHIRSRGRRKFASFARKRPRE